VCWRAMSPTFFCLMSLHYPLVSRLSAACSHVSSIVTPPFPQKKSQTFSTAADGQTAIEVKVYQGERELVRDNKLLGNFQLTGLPPAPKGVPQIQISFDIDADGIVNVGAIDKATNREQSMTIASSSGLSDKEIENMVADAEKFAESDKIRRQVIEEANRGESFCADTEKSMAEFDAQLDAKEKESVKEKLAALREIAAKGAAGDASVKPEDIKAALDAAQQASLGLFQKVYEKRNADARASESSSSESESSSPDSGSTSESSASEGEKKN